MNRINRRAVLAYVTNMKRYGLLHTVRLMCRKAIYVGNIAEAINLYRLQVLGA